MGRIIRVYEAHLLAGWILISGFSRILVAAAVLSGLETLLGLVPTGTRESTLTLLTNDVVASYSRQVIDTTWTTGGRLVSVRKPHPRSRELEIAKYSLHTQRFVHSDAFPEAYGRRPT